MGGGGRREAGPGWAARAGFAVGICLAATAAFAQQVDRPNRRVGFSVERSREVANDWATALLSVTHEDPSAAEVAARINRDMAFALDLAKKRSSVRARTSGYTTLPIQDPKRGNVRHWRGTQELVLESGDVAALTGLIGELQAKLQLQSLAFSVSPGQRRKVEEELAVEALEAFQARADLVRKTFGASGYRLVEVHVGTGGGGPPPRPMMREMMAADAAMMPPAVEGGTSEITASANGSIELD
jgi:predicted secreted protein